MQIEKVKSTITKLPFAVFSVHAIRSFWYGIESYLNFCRERRIKRDNKPIRVTFICQYIPSWDKVKLIYERMAEDDRFKPIILCVPSGISGNRLIDPNDLSNDTYDYFEKHGYKNIINALIEKNKWQSIKELNSTYIIYTRPYNSFLPIPYISNNASKYSKICLVLYGINLSRGTVDTVLNKGFMSYVYCYFAETEYIRDVNIARNKLVHRLKLQKTIFCGLPVLENVLTNKNTNSPAWQFSKHLFRVLWTPRWSTDPFLGGSNFFTYFNEIFDFAEKHKEMDFLVRPHPLMFSNFLRRGEMSQEDIDQYKERCEISQNVSLDKEKDYIATFWGSSVLVSDMSSIIPEYLVTSKPIIYCESDIKWDLLPLGEKMLAVCYKVHNSEELFSCLLLLSQGVDPLMNMRKTVVREFLGQEGASPSKQIVEELAMIVNC